MGESASRMGSMGPSLGLPTWVHSRACGRGVRAAGLPTYAARRRSPSRRPATPLSPPRSAALGRGASKRNGAPKHREGLSEGEDASGFATVTVCPLTAD